MLGHFRSRSYKSRRKCVINGAIRELKEELGVKAKEKDLQYITTIKSTKNPKKLKIYWSPETEKRVLENMKVQFNDKDYRLFKEKFC